MVFDVLMAIMTIVLITFGIKRGLVGEIFRFGALVGAFAGAVFLYKKVYTLLPWHTLPVYAKNIIAFVAVYALFVAAILLIGWLIGKLISLTPLGVLNHLLGGCVGLIEAVLVAWLCILIVFSQPVQAIKKAIGPSYTCALFTLLPEKLKRVHIVNNKPGKKPGLFQFKPIKQVKSAEKSLEHLKEKIDSAKSVLDSVSNDHGH